jgi:dipeptidyl aminopeptidase/acylaminoacyl peptidase
MTPGAAAVIVLIVVVAAVGYLAISARLYGQITAVPPDSPLFGSPNTPASFSMMGLDCRPYRMPGHETVEFPDRTRSVGISGWWIPVAGDPAAPCVVVVHGYASCRRDPAILLAAGMLHRAGFAVLAIDLRNHGESGRTGGRHTGGIREQADVLGAWDWLVRERHQAPGRIGLFGISLGAASVLMAAGAEPAVAAAWSDSSYGDLDEATAAELRRNRLPAFLLPGGRLAARLLDGPGLGADSPLRGVAAMTGRAVFITHGTRDTRLHVRFADELIEAGATAGAHVGSWIVDGSEHAEAIVDHPAEYERRLVDFFGRALRGDVS